MNIITRKNFLGGLIAIASSAAAGSMMYDDGLDDIYDDKYYDLQGGPYKDTGGIGAPGKAWLNDLLNILRHEDHCRNLDYFMEHVERNGFYFTVSLYFPHTHQELEKYGHKKIILTKKWLISFYNKHHKKAYDE